VATETIYLLDAKAPGINHMDTSTVAPSAADGTAGWTGAGGGAVVDRYADVFAGVTRARTTLTAGAKPTTIDTTNGNGWRLTPTAKTGTYAAGNWSLSFRPKDSGGNGTSDVAVSFLFWKSSNADGSGGSAVGTQQVTSVATNCAAGGTTVTASYDPSGGAGLTLSNEYLFLLAGLWTDSAGTGLASGSVIIFRLTGTTSHAVVTPNFTASGGSWGPSLSDQLNRLVLA